MILDLRKRQNYERYQNLKEFLQSKKSFIFFTEAY